MKTQPNWYSLIYKKRKEKEMKTLYFYYLVYINHDIHFEMDF